MNILSFFLCLFLSVFISCAVTFAYIKPSTVVAFNGPAPVTNHVNSNWQESFFNHPQLYIPTHEYVTPIEENDNRGMKLRTFLVRRSDKTTMTVLASDLALTPER